MSTQEASARHEKDIHTLKIFEIVSMIVLIGVLAFLSYHILQSFRYEDVYQEVLGSEATFNLILMFWGAMTIQAALMIRTSFVRLSRNKIGDKTGDNPFAGWRFTFFNPLIGTLILLPAITAGVFNDDSVGTVGSFFLILGMSFIALLLSALVAAFIIAPLELLIRGIVGVIRGDRSKASYVFFGLVVGAITAVTILGAMAVDTNRSYPAGSFQALLALLGIPGAYDVKDETLLWVARGIVAAIVVFCIYVSKAEKKSDNKL